ncbi:MAG: Hsp33 family molecular chaperone HslO [Clostridiales bacterium]|nr:Hsp33 family molecular chaperone HslO [Clostridiales bacterium]
MGKIVRCISVDGSVSVVAIDSTDIVSKSENLHKTSAVTSAALGRLLTAASMMGDNLKGENDTLTLRLKGDGPAGTLLASADSSGNVKGYVINPVVEIPLNSKGKLDVAGAVGRDGSLTVIKDMGMKEPYVGQVPIVSGEIAEDITNYFATSEQIPTVCALGVLVNPDLSIKASGGFLIQLLPFASEEVISKVEKSIDGLESISAMIEKGMTPEEICRKVLSEFELDVLDEAEPEYKCDCSAQRVTKALISMGKDGLTELLQDEETQVVCDFCHKEYNFKRAEIEKLIEKAKK